MHWRYVWSIKQVFYGQIIYLPDQDINACISKGIIYTMRVGKQFSTLKYFRLAIESGNISSLFERKFCVIIGYAPITQMLFFNPTYNNYLIEKKMLSNVHKHTSLEHKTLIAMGNILRSVLTPTTKTMNVMKRLFPEYDNLDYTGVHLRIGGNFSDAKFFFQFINISNIYPIFDYIKNASVTDNIYLSSDSAFVKKEAKKYFHNYNIYFYEGYTNMMDTQSSSYRDDPEQIRIAVAELLLLSHSNTCIGTDKSTFSKVGCALGGMIPLMVSDKSCNKYVKTKTS